MVIKITASHDTTSTNHAIIRHMRTFLNHASVSYPHFVIKKQLEIQVNSLVTEASRIEAGRRLVNSNSEVTQSDVLAVTLNSKQFAGKKVTSISKKIMKSLAIVVTWFSGWLFKAEKFSTDGWLLYGFLFCLIIAVGLNVYLIFNEDGK